MELPLEPPTELTPRPRRRRRWRYVVGALVALVAVFAVLHWPSPVKIIISRETTRIDGPLNPDGTVNYVAALDAEMSKGVTPENNAAVPILRVIGPVLLNPKTQDDVLRRLGNPSLGDANGRFVSLASWAEAHLRRTEGPGATTRATELNRELRSQLARASEAPWTAKDYPLLAQWLDDNAQALEQLAVASRLPDYYIPLTGESDPPLMGEAVTVCVYPLRELALALGASWMRRLGQGDTAGAWSETLVLRRLGRLISRRPTLIDLLLGRACDAQAARCGVAIASRIGLTVAQAKAMLADLRSLPEFGELSDVMDKPDRYMQLDVIMLVYRSGPRASGLRHVPDTSSALDWNEMLRFINERQDRIVAGLRQPTPADVKRSGKVLDDEMRRWLDGRSAVRLILLRLAGRPARKALSREVTRLLCLLFSNTGASVAEEIAAMAARVELERAALALAAHMGEHGHWPTDLKHLVPEYLARVPQDPFTAGPLTYRARPDGYILYSVGPNMTDDGGKEVEDSDDIAVEVPRRGGT